MLPVDALKAGAAGLFVGLTLGWLGLHQFYAPRLELERERVTVLGGQIEEQNAAIERLKTDAAARAKRAAAAIAAAQADAEAAQRDAMDLLTREVPQGVDRCTAASVLVREELAK